MDLPMISSLQEEIVFKQIEGKKFKNENVQNITIKNSTLKDCVFSDVDLYNCDILNCRVENTNFINTNLGSADIFSTWFCNCNFNNVDFSGASIEDITFIFCEFHNCIFKSVSVKNNTFTNVIFEGINPESSIFSLNSYENCTFNMCYFIETFQYQIFTSCKFEQVKIDSILLKSNFGLGNVDGLVYQLKGDIVKDIGRLKILLANECKRQNFPIGAVLVNYNFEQEINPELAIKSLDAVEIMLRHDILLRTDELIFLKNLYHYLYTKKLIAPISLYIMFQKANTIFRTSLDNIAYSKSKDQLLLIANSLYFDFCDFCKSLQNLLLEVPDYIAPAQIVIHYGKEPDTELSELLNFYNPNTFKRIYAKQGSFIEGIEVGKYGLEIFAIFINILGIAIPISYSEIKQKKKDMAQEPVNRELQKEVNIEISLQEDNTKSAEIIQQTCQMLTNSNILSNDFQGYNNTNIKEINVKYQISIHA